ncbi:MAG: hypothetical protein EZS26_003580 [Candidatus Ordinivivax streblomastigis]|uniref:Glycosyl hydrolases family 2 sugar binding domain-containing protein n=1 Tax=Candidatus Ordinivivax streblomastigis TaxID=2540710 RepID=A0A5M8NY58_9BACT|nr:MAG: hypothetical protein EZS26_003580 [Candidatus Ordinivivax streblomastigis]
MLQKRSIFLLFLLVQLTVNAQKKELPESSITGFDALNHEFRQPSKDYGTAPLWVWNTKVTREIIDRSLSDLKGKGFGGVFVHPRPGMITEYLSDEWFDLYRYSVDKAKELEMHVWIYDENSYPSGFAGGHVPALMPESYNQGQGLRLTKVAALPDNADSYFLCLKEKDGGYIDVTSDLKKEAGKEGNYYLFSKTYHGQSPWHGGYSYVDLIYPGVTQKFLEVTMTGYEKHLGNEFGKSILGCFTDEPNIQSPGGIRWTPDLFEVFQQRWGYDLKAVLPALYEEVGEWKTIRHNYFQTLLQLFIDRWAKPYHDYCAAHNLKFTGHYWEHDWPSVPNGPDNMAMYAWHQVPAIDLLFNQFNEESPNAQFGNIRAVKELRSVANQMGYRRTLSETYGGGAWEETFRDFKRHGDWEYVLGVNFMNQHIADMSIAGARKYDYPPVFSDAEPWWDYYQYLNLHFARLSMVLSAGEQLNDILIIEPTTTVWLYFTYSNGNKKFREIGKAFQTFVTTLEKAQAEYDLGSENIIKDHGRITKGKFVINKRAYSKVVIPPMTENLDAPTFKLLKEFAKKGGTILAFSKPNTLDGKPCAEMEKFFNEDTHVQAFDALTPAIIGKEFAVNGLAITRQGGNLFHHRRVMADGQVLFLVNSSLTEAQKGIVSIAGKDAVVLNTLTGEMQDYPETTAGKNIQLNFELSPAGSLLLYVFNKKQQGFKPFVSTGQFLAQPGSSPVKVVPQEKNVLAIDFCDLQIGKESFSDLHVCDAADKAYKFHGFAKGNPWNTSVQFKDNIVRRDTFKTGGFTTTYRFTVVGDFDKSGMQAVVEHPELYKVSLNGSVIKSEAGKWWLDHDTGIFPIGSKVKRGENTLVIELSPMKVLAEIEPVYILGDFTVQSADKGWTINPPAPLMTGSWKGQGWNFYSGAVSYSKTYEISDPNAVYRVCLGNWSGTVAEVLVNGEQAGIVGFEPYSADVTGKVRKGANTIEVKIVGSNKNLLGPFHNNPPVGIAGPWLFQNVKRYPSGKEYQQLDYGLTGDFWLEKGYELPGTSVSTISFN